MLYVIACRDNKNDNPNTRIRDALGRIGTMAAVGSVQINMVRSKLGPIHKLATASHTLSQNGYGLMVFDQFSSLFKKTFFI